MKWLLPCLVVFVFGCKAPKINLFANASPHEQYGDKLKDAGLLPTTLGAAWFAAADQSLNNPRKVTLPYKEWGYFPAAEARAYALAFGARRGEQLHIRIEKKTRGTLKLFADLWQLDAHRKPQRVAFFDTAATQMEHTVGKDGVYILRLQPELLQSGEYTVSLHTGPSLTFPVAGTKKIGSYWGAPRDGGRRKHEGIDIFAPRGTPAVAAASGRVTRVGENNLGGKVVFIKPEEADFSLYYAHLDVQTVREGQEVQAGAEVGRVGNTGNASTSSPHLHFGIYTSQGAVDPLPFVNPDPKMPAEVKQKPDFEGYYTWRENSRNSLVVKALSASADSTWVITSAGSLLHVSAKSIQKATPVKAFVTENETYVFEAPEASSPRMKQIKPGTRLKVLGTYQSFHLVEYEAAEYGWIKI